MRRPEGITLNIHLGNHGADARRTSYTLRQLIELLLGEAYRKSGEIYRQARLGPLPCPPFVLLLADERGSVHEAPQTKGQVVFSRLRIEAGVRLGDDAIDTGKATAYQIDKVAYRGNLCVVTGVEDPGNPHKPASRDDVATILAALASETIRKSLA